MASDISSLLWWSLSVGFIILSIKWWLSYYRKWKMLSKVPGPKGVPILGNALDLNVSHEKIPDVFRGWWAEYGKSHGICKIHLLTQPFIIPCQPKMLENIINDTPEKSYDYTFLRPWLGEGLLISHGEKWRRRRKQLTPAFHFRILEEFNAIFNEQSEVLVSKLMAKVGKSFDIFPLITHCALDIICETAMGQSMNAQEENDSEYVNALYGVSDIVHSRMFKPWMWPDFIFALTSLGKKHNQYLKILHDFTKKVIQDRKAKRREGDVRSSYDNEQNESFGRKRRLAFLDLLLEMSETENSLTDEEIREEVDTFMFEGHDTTAAAISWVIYLLGHYPDVQEKVQNELDTVLGPTKRDVTSEDIKKLKYLECVIKESLRLYPSVPLVSREAKKDTVVGDYTIPEKSTLVLFIYFLHRDPVVFPNPEEFNPDRFSTSNSVGRHPYIYIPFSAGPRNCIGQKFALEEEKVVLSHLLRSFKIESMEPRENMKLLFELILRPQNGISVKLTPR